MDIKHLLSIFSSDGILPPEKLHAIEKQHASKPFSLHWEFRILLYTGISLFAAGIGFLVYQNIDTIGHTFLIALIGLSAAACFWFAFKSASPFSKEEVRSKSPLPDYILLLGCLLFLTFEGYLQFQYAIFGERYGLATLIPSLLFIALAYRFDHKGVLSMAITGIAGWLGIAATPMDIFDNDFTSFILIWTALGYGTALVGLSVFSEKKKIKAHFGFTYLNFGANLFLLAALSGLFMSEELGRTPYVLMLGGAVYLAIWYARKELSYYFLLIASLYGYVGFTTVFFLLVVELFDNEWDLLVWLGVLYFIASCGAIVYFFLNYKKFLTKKA